MKTTFNNIEYIIKKLVEYQVKQWCSDVRWDGSTRLLPLHCLSAAKQIAYDLGHCKDGWHYKVKDITVHMRPLNNIRELNDSVARDIIHYIDANKELNCCDRFIKDNDKTERKSVYQYFDEGYGDDTVVLFLVENEMYAVKDKEKPKSLGFDDNNSKKISLKETPEERAERHRLDSIKKRKMDDERIQKGRIIAAVEMRPSMSNAIWTSEETGKKYTWTDFRTAFSQAIADGDTECGAYKNANKDEYAGWSVACCESVTELFQQYALKNLDDAYFMQKLVKDLPEFAVFKNADDCDKYEENEKKVNEFRKTLDWPTMIRL